MRAKAYEETHAVEQVERLPAQGSFKLPARKVVKLSTSLVRKLYMCTVYNEIHGRGRLYVNNIQEDYSRVDHRDSRSRQRPSRNKDICICNFVPNLCFLLISQACWASCLLIFPGSRDSFTVALQPSFDAGLIVVRTKFQSMLIGNAI